MAGWKDSQVLMKQPISLTHLKIYLGCLLEYREKMGERAKGLRVLFRGAIGETPRELD